MDLTEQGQKSQVVGAHVRRHPDVDRFLSVTELQRAVTNLRARLEPAFGPETAIKQSGRPVSVSAGQCAAVATIVQAMLGGEFVSANVGAHSHWFNRIPVGGDPFDADITGDQFGLPAIQLARAGRLYRGSRVRRPAEVDRNTRMRAELLARRAGVHDVNYGTH